LSVSPTTVNAGGTVTITSHITDAGSGVASAFICYRIGPSSGGPCAPNFVLVSGTPQDGIWQTTLTVPLAAASATWTVSVLGASDAALNSMQLNSPTPPTTGGTFTVAGGNDTTPPTIQSLSVSPATVVAGGTVTITSRITDAGSGVASAFICYRIGPSSGGPCAPNFVLVSGTPQDGIWQTTLTVPLAAASATWTVSVLGASDAALNSMQLNSPTPPTTGGTFTVAPKDTTPPVITPTVLPAPNQAGWNNSVVTVTWALTDPESGVASSSGCGSTSITSETAGTVVTCSATNGAGLIASKSVTIKLDKTPPSMTAAVSTSPNANGWYNGPVTVHFTCSDFLSGLAPTACPADAILKEGANQLVSGTVTDLAGNSATASLSGINIDLTPPSLTASATSNGSPYVPSSWTNHDVTVAFSCTDDLSGVASASGPTTLAVEGANQSVTGTCTDKAGNAARTTVGGVDIDKTPPTITGARTPAANGNGWYNTDVTVSFTCTDTLSGVASMSQPSTLSTEGIDQSATGTCTDKAGNAATVTLGGINIDKTPPTVTAAGGPAANATGWNNTDVTVTFACADTLSGVASVTGPRTLTTEGANQSVTGTCTDKAGNVASRTASGISIDKTPPTITSTRSPAANTNSWNNTDVSVTFGCSDSLSGVATVSQPIVLSVEGANQSATGSCTDRAGNMASTTLGGINIDKTPPTVTYAGNSASYTVDQAVNISCSAFDSLSGVATSTCKDINGPAYSFSLGLNTFSSTATDKAGNIGSGSVTLTVRVTFTSLCNLTGQFVTDGAIANSLCVKLDAASAAAAAGNVTAKIGALKAYTNEVAAQSGKSLTEARAAILARLAGAL
jgi:hypothetical protein